MALVMLPCDLPWWDNVKDHLTRIGKIDNVEELIDEMEKLYELCNISLDPDDENPEPDLFKGFELFLKNDLTKEENSNFFNKTLKIISNRALQLKDKKPKNGLHFSLQQQPDYTELDYEFVLSLIANAFFSIFPKRTIKSHPTLRNFNFSNFFKNLHLNVQKTKLKSILHYFDWLNINLNNNYGKLKIIRNVMNGKEWLTIEDWLECNLPLCQIIIKHDGKIERSEANSLKILFASSKIGEKVLIDGISQESINLITFPELLIILLNVESLEDNEVLTIDNVRHITRINDPKNKAILEKLEYPYTTSICCMDADNYTKLPIGQYEEDNILRELNKCLLGFQQKQQNLNNNNNENYTTTTNPHQRTRKLSPIGEKTIPLITQESCSTTRSDSFKLNDTNDNKLKVQRNINSELVHNRRGKFIVLGSSGECLPVTRRPLETMKTIYSSCNSSDEEFHSAKTSLDDDSEDETFHHKYSIDLDTSERREIFAKKIKNVLNNENSSSSTDSNSYAVGISITGSEVRDTNIKVKRDGSTGFALKEESLDELFLQNSLTKEQK